MDGQFLLNGLLYSGFPVEGECLKKAAHMAKESTCVMYKAQFNEYAKLREHNILICTHTHTIYTSV